MSLKKRGVRSAFDIVNIDIPKGRLSIGIPNVNIYGEPSPSGAQGGIPAYTIPDYVKNILTILYGDGKIAFGTGNIINPYSVIEETIKDGVKEIDDWCLDYKIKLWPKIS